MEKGNAAGLVAAVPGVAEAMQGGGLVERTTTVTSVLADAGSGAATSIRNKLMDKGADAALDEARDRLRRDKSGEEPPTDAGESQT